MASGEDRALSKTPAAAPRRRLGAGERERQIIEAAIAFFAEVGLDGNTRELARRIGITQPLLYRYFPSKEQLLERIYEELYIRRWKPEWEALMADRSLPVMERFRRFEKDYQRTILTHDWLRIFVSSGLQGYAFPTRYLARVKEWIFTPVLAELRREMKLPAPDALPLSAGEYELLFALHGALVYAGIRRYVYAMAVPDDLEAGMDATLDAFLPGMPAVLRRLVAEAEAVQRAAVAGPASRPRIIAR